MEQNNGLFLNVANLKKTGEAQQKVLRAMMKRPAKRCGWKAKQKAGGL